MTPTARGSSKNAAATGAAKKPPTASVDVKTMDSAKATSLVL
jgi:hypothetical protein